MRTISRLALTILNSLGGIGPFAVGGELPGIPQDKFMPAWILMSFAEFPFPEAAEIESARRSALNSQDWKSVFRKLFFIFKSKKRTRKSTAILFNNMAYSAYRSGKRARAHIIIGLAAKIPITNIEVSQAIKHNLDLFK